MRWGGSGAIPPCRHQSAVCNNAAIGTLPHRHRAKVRAKVAFCKGDHKGAGFVVLRRATVYDCTRSGFVILRRDKPGTFRSKARDLLQFCAAGSAVDLIYNSRIFAEHFQITRQQTAG